MFSMEDSASSGCARLMRGTASMASAVRRRRARSATSPGLVAGDEQRDERRSRAQPVELF
jgi:hypothetical protein